jgi:hypothetical protein
MPGRNGNGPLGQGPQNRRGQGLCNVKNAMGFGMGSGKGRGYGRGCVITSLNSKPSNVEDETALLKAEIEELKATILELKSANDQDQI